MAEHRPGLHLLRAGEALLRAGADALAGLRERAEREEPEALERLLAELGGRAFALLREDPTRSLDEIRRALTEEHERWAERAAHDPAARRMRDGIAALLLLFGRDAGASRARRRGASHTRARRGFAPR